MCNEYNGWTNYPTWCAHLWLTNDPGSTEYYESLAEGYDHISTFADVIQAEFEEGAYNAASDNMWSDLLGWAVGMINWHELAGAFWPDDKPHTPAE